MSSLDDYLALADDDPVAPRNTDPKFGGMSPAAARTACMAGAQRAAQLRLVDASIIADPPPPAGLADYGLGSPAPVAVKNFRPTPIDGVTLTRLPAWVIHGLIPARGLVVIVGPPKSGKSFFATDMFLSVACDRSYGGRAVLPGSVFYCTGEGQSGARRRLVAMRRNADIEGKGVPFHLVENVPDLGSPTTDVHQLIDEIERFVGSAACPPPRAIILDTLARCMGAADENAAGDMGRVLDRCAMIEQQLGCVVVLVHHTGKDPARGARGSNALNGALDVLIVVEKHDGYSTAKVAEMKDGREGQEWRFCLVPFATSATSEDDPATTVEVATCVVELLSDPRAAQPKAQPQAKAVQGVAGDLLNVIRHAIEEAGTEAHSAKDIPKSVRAVSRKTLKAYCTTMGWQDHQSDNGIRAMLSKTLSQLRARKAIGFDTEWVWII